jgi:hypothetical protein
VCASVRRQGFCSISLVAAQAAAGLMRRVSVTIQRVTMARQLLK